MHYASGYELFSGSPSHDDKIIAVYAVKRVEPNRKNWLRPSIIEFDMSDTPQNIPFTLITEMTYWSAFQDMDGSWPLMDLVANRSAEPRLWL